MLLIFGLLGYAHAATTTVTGTINDLTGAAVTSGQVTFELKPGLDTTISGSARFVPSTVTCYINGSGVIKGDVAFATSCTVVQNTSLTPNGTYYLVCLWPSNTKTSCFNWYALAASFDITTAVPTPATSPAFTFADLVSNQTIGGNKTASGNWTFTPEATFNAGTKPLFVESQSTPSTTGFIRAGNAECFKFRNAGNSADVNGLCMNGSNQATIGSGPFVIPAVPDTAVGKATVDTLTNKTYDTAGAGNVFKINGSTVSAVTGTGAAVLQTSPTITTPTISSPAITSPAFSTGVAQGSGFKHQRVASCTTAAVANAVCTTTVTWGTAFADNNYTVTCVGGPNSNGQVAVIDENTKSASSVNVTIGNMVGNSAAASTTLNCIAVHD